MTYLKLIFLFIFINLFGQNINSVIIEYKFHSDNYNSKNTLYVSNQHAYFVNDSIYFGHQDAEYLLNETEHTIRKFEKPEMVKRTIMCRKLDSTKVIFEDYFSPYSQFNDKVKYTVSDNVPEIAWKLIPNQTKKIANYTCEKAIADFRGNKIFAYYTSEIPMNAGPYKFSGLPGIILELGEQFSNNNHWTTSKIILNSNEGLNQTKYTFKNSIPIQKYIGLKVKFMKKVFQTESELEKAKHPDSNILFTYQRPEIEKYYEWENPSKDILEQY